MTIWQLGEVERARELIDEANRRAKELGHVPSMAHPLNWRSRLEILRGDAAAALSAAETLEGLCREHGMPYWRVKAELDAEWARGRLHDAAAGADGLRRALAAAADQGMMSDAWFYTALLAELEAKTLGADSALERIDEALVLAHQVDDRYDLPFPHLIRGEFLLKRDPADPAPAEEAFRPPSPSRKSKARAAMTCKRRYRSPSSTNRPVAPSKPTPSSRRRSKAFRRRRRCRRSPRRRRCSRRSRKRTRSRPFARHEQRLHLQTAYGQAMMLAKGLRRRGNKGRLRARRRADGEDRQLFRAFRRVARSIVSGVTAGELRSARELALTLLREAEDARQRTEAGMADSFLGLVAFWQGDFVEARTHYERALAAPDPNKTRSSGRLDERTGIGTSSPRPCGNWARSNARAS